MNEKGICFISCVNDSVYEEECIRYINRLNIPKGYEVNQISVYDAKSMAAGYNEAMEASDAKYKIYLHQDVFILDKDFLGKIIAVFDRDKSIGMIGMAGSKKMPESGVMWDGDMCGLIYSSTVSQTGDSLFDWPQNPYTEVESIDGLLMATAYDIPWREDIFTGFDFYDASQSFEVRRAGYKVVIPDMGVKPWVFHDSKVLNMGNYDYYRKKFIKEYL